MLTRVEVMPHHISFSIKAAGRFGIVGTESPLSRMQDHTPFYNGWQRVGGVELPRKLKFGWKVELFPFRKASRLHHTPQRVCSIMERIRQDTPKINQL